MGEPAGGARIGEPRAVLTAALAATNADMLPTDQPDELDVSGDDWTLHLEGWPDQPLAWLALDDEPEETMDRRSELRRALGADVLAALAAADTQLSGRLGEALRAGADPLSIDLADALAAPDLA